LNLCLISHLPELGGAERVLLEVIDVLEESNVNCHVIVHQPGPMLEILKEKQVPYAIIPFRSWVTDADASIIDRKLRYFRRRIRNWFLHYRACRWIRRWKCTAVLSNTCTIYFGILCAKRLSVPHVHYIHEFGLLDHNLAFDWGAAKAKKYIQQNSRKVLFISSPVQQHYESGTPWKNACILESAIDVPRQLRNQYRNLPSLADGLKIIVAGQIKPQKGQIDAIRAAISLHKQKIPVLLDIVGKGEPSYLDKLWKMIRAEDAKTYIRVLGWRKDALWDFLNYNVLVVPSKNEAFGRVTVEAMKIGLPVTGTTTGYTPSIVDHGKTGMLYEPGDINGLTDCLKKLYYNRQLHKRISEAAFQMAEHRFNKSKYSDKLVKIVTRQIQMNVK